MLRTKENRTAPRIPAADKKGTKVGHVGMHTLPDPPAPVLPFVRPSRFFHQN